MAKKAPQRNIAACVPRRQVDHETGDDGSIKLLIPRFRASWLQWLQRRLKNKYIKVSLDEIGSCAWRHMDGTSTVAEVGERMHEELGEKVEPVHERLGFFLGMLKRNKFVDWDEKDVTEQPPTPEPIKPE